MEFDIRGLIKEKYPLAYEKCRLFFVERDKVHVASEQENYLDWVSPLELCFFFDEQGINGNVNRIYHGEILGQLYYSVKPFRVVDKTSFAEFATSDAIYTSRSEALTALWLKEFSILESRLEEEKG